MKYVCMCKKRCLWGVASSMWVGARKMYSDAGSMCACATKTSVA